MRLLAVVEWARALRLHGGWPARFFAVRSA
jgi:hypothetical protein